MHGVIEKKEKGKRAKLTLFDDGEADNDFIFTQSVLEKDWRGSKWPGSHGL